MVNARVTVFLKQDVMDPQGTAVGQALHSLGHTGVKQVRVGRAFDLQIDGEASDSLKADIAKMCESLLANTVVEKYEIEIDPAEKAMR